MGLNSGRLHDSVTTAQLSAKADIAQEAWITATLLNGWVNLSPSVSPPQYRKNSFGKVEIRGAVKLGTIGAVPIFTLPSGYRPAKDVYQITLSNSDVGQIYIDDATGNVCALTGNNASFSLDGIDFYTT